MTARGSLCVVAMFVLALADARPTSAQKQVEVIVAVVHTSNGASDITAADLKNIYLGRKKTWSGGAVIRPFIRPPTGSAGFTFYRNVLNMTPARFRHHWQEQELSGQGTAPKTLASASAVVETVSGDKGAVSFMTEAEAASAGNAVKIVKIK